MVDDAQPHEVGFPSQIGGNDAEGYLVRRTSLVEQQSDLDFSACSTENELGEADAVIPQNPRFFAKPEEARRLAGVLTIVE